MGRKGRDRSPECPGRAGRRGNGAGSPPGMPRKGRRRGKCPGRGRNAPEGGKKGQWGGNGPRNAPEGAGGAGSVPGMGRKGDWLPARPGGPRRKERRVWPSLGSVRPSFPALSFPSAKAFQGRGSTAGREAGRICPAGIKPGAKGVEVRTPESGPEWVFHRREP